MGTNHGFGHWLTEYEAVSAICLALDFSVTFLDTAQIYGLFIDEGLVGKVPVRELVLIAMKFGFGYDGPGN